MKERFLKRIVAGILTLCLVFGQGFVPAGLIDVKLASHVDVYADDSDTRVATAGTWLGYKTGQTDPDTITNIQYNYILLDDGTAAITGVTTAYLDSLKGYSSFAVEFPAYLEKDGDGNTITAIKVTQLGRPYDNSGSKMDSLLSITGVTSVTIPTTVTTINQNAFNNTGALTTVNFASSSSLTTIKDSAFGNNENLTSITIPSSVTTMGSALFEGCSKLEKVTVSDGSSDLSIGEYCFSSTNSSNYLSNLATVTLPERTTSIGNHAFSNCKALTDFTLPSKVTTLSAGTFLNCEKLESINLDNISNFDVADKSNGDVDGVFEGCTGLTSIDLSKSGVTKIAQETFSGCGSIEGDPQLSDNVTTIGEKAFANCTLLFDNADSDGNCSFNIPSGVTTIGNYAFQNCTSPNYINWNNAPVTSIGKGAFSGNNLTSVTIPAQVTQIADYTFQGASEKNKSAMRTLFLPTTVTSIGISAFQYTSLNQISFYEGNDTSKEAKASESKITTIGSSAFAGTSLTSLIIPVGVKQIENSTFNGCALLSSITWNNVEKIGNSAFCKASIAELELPSSVSDIGSNAFKECNSLTSIDLSKTSIKTVAEGTFSAGDTEDKNLTTVKLPKSVVSIGKEAFNNRKSLESVTLESMQGGLVSIADKAFYNCASLSSISSADSGRLVFPSTFTTLGTSAFYGCKAITSVDLSNTSVSAIPVSCFDSSNVQIVSFPLSLTKITSKAFNDCTISTLSFLNPSTPQVSTGSDASFTCDSVSTVYIPANAEDAYKSLLETDLGLTVYDYKQNEVPSTSLTLSKTSLEIYVGQESTSVTATLSKGATEGITVTTDKPEIVSVSAGAASTTSNGASVINVNVKGLKLGSATVTVATSTQSKTFTVKVTPNTSAAAYVKNPIVKIEPTVDNQTVSSVDMCKGQTLIITTNLTSGSGSTEDTANEDAVTWSINDTKYPETKRETNAGVTTVTNDVIQIVYDNNQATVTVLDGTVTANISLSVSSVCTAEQKLTLNLKPQLTSITSKVETDGVSKASIAYTTSTIDAKSKYFTFAPTTNGESSQLTWSSNNTQVATIDSNGIITPVGIGTTIISVKSPYSNLEKQVELTITNDITSVTLDKTAFEVLAGESVQATATVQYNNQSITSNDSLTWTSSNEKVATVTPSADGKTLTIKTLTAGNAKITAANTAGKTVGSINVTASALKLSKTSYSIYSKGPNKSAKIEIATTLPSDASITYEMADAKSKKVASVSSNGTVTGKAAGSAKVNVTVNGTNTASCTITVTEAKLNVSFAGANVKTKTKKKKTTTTYELSRKKLKKKSSITLKPNFLGSTKQKVTYKSSKKSVITVDKKGKMKLKKKGTATITVTCNGVSEKYTVKVVK